MLEPKLPTNEDERLSALKNLEILDTPAEESFERITRLAKRIFNVPISTISLIDKDRQWFKSSQGLSICETSREISFCGHAILKNSLFVVPDTLEDERFVDNPLVIGPPFIRFYAGYPIRTNNGLTLGMLCILDVVPHTTFSEEETEDLKNLASLVETELCKYAYSNTQKQLVHELGQAQRAAMIDPLTRLWNRSGFESILGQQISESVRARQTLGLAMIDIDHFKTINDTYGHNIGDKVLHQVGLELLKCCRDKDATGRWGGEEFIVLIAGVNEADLVVIAERIRQTIAACSIETDAIDSPIQLTVTIGVCHFTPDQLIQNYQQQLIQKVDEALYRGKNNGRNQVVKF